MQVEENAALYIISVRPDPGSLDGVGSTVRLSEGLYVCRTRRTRSRLYHDVKATARPDQLLVAPLLDLPKFKGMEPGVTQSLSRFKA